MPITQTDNVTIATKPTRNLFTLSLLRIPTGIELDFQSELLLEYFEGIQRGSEYPLDHWKNQDGDPMQYKQLVFSRLPADITNEHEWRNADGQLYSNGYATFSWVGCQSYPVRIQGVYTQDQLDRYANTFINLMKNLYLKVLKPYQRKVTLTYALEE